MEMTVERRDIATNIDTSHRFQIEASEKAFQILSANLYKNVKRAIVRELCCNGIDAENMVGYTGGIDVCLPTRFNPIFFVRDHGIGMSEDDVFNLYTTYFASSKTKRNDQIGALGLGSKTPFSYTDSFNIKTTKDGKTLHFAALISADKIPVVSKLSERAAEKGECGTEVSFPIKEEDFDEFTFAALVTFASFTSMPNIVSGRERFEQMFAEKFSYYNSENPMEKFLAIRRFFSSDNLYDVSSATDDGEKYEHLNIVEKFTDTALNNQHTFATMGGITYPIDLDIVLSEKVLSKADYLFSSHARSSRLFNNMLLNLAVPIGAVNIAPSREELTYDTRTISYLKERILLALAKRMNVDATMVTIPKNPSFSDFLEIDRILNKSTLFMQLGKSYSNVANGKDTTFFSDSIVFKATDPLILKSVEEATALVASMKKVKIPLIRQTSAGEQNYLNGYSGTDIESYGYHQIFSEGTIFVYLPEAKADAFHVKLMAMFGEGTNYTQKVHGRNYKYIADRAKIIFSSARNKAILKTYIKNPDVLDFLEKKSGISSIIWLDKRMKDDADFLEEIGSPYVFSLDELVLPKPERSAYKYRGKTAFDNETCYGVGDTRNMKYEELRKLAEKKRVYYTVFSTSRGNYEFYKERENGYSCCIDTIPYFSCQHRTYTSMLSEVCSSGTFYGLLRSKGADDVDGSIALVSQAMKRDSCMTRFFDDGKIVVKIPYTVFKAEKIWNKKNFISVHKEGYEFLYSVYKKAIGILSKSMPYTTIPTFTNDAVTKKLVEKFAILYPEGYTTSMLYSFLVRIQHQGTYEAITTEAYEIAKWLKGNSPIAKEFNLPRIEVSTDSKIAFQREVCKDFYEGGTSMSKQDAEILERYPMLKYFKGEHESSYQSRIVCLSDNRNPKDKDIREDILRDILTYAKTIDSVSCK